MDYNMEEIGRRLRQLRGDRTQAEIAQEIGVTPMAISQYESGNRMPKGPIMMRLARVFGVSVEDLFFKF